MYESQTTQTSKSSRWEDTFRRWSKPPSETEEQRCENAVSMIRTAIGRSEELQGRSSRVFGQGSYRNNTNVRLESDVDVCICCSSTVFLDLPPGVSKTSLGYSDATYDYADFKNEVGRALAAYFGPEAVKRGNKAFDIHANSYRVDADAVPCFAHRQYRYVNGFLELIEGTELRPDSGGRIINWPEQHYENGVAKNNATGTRFKKVVRILKRLRNQMDDAGIAEAKPIPSYLIECLVWNAPNSAFGHELYTDDVRLTLANVLSAILDGNAEQWFEVNGIKALFSASQPWTVKQAQDFLLAAWIYLGWANQ